MSGLSDGEIATICARSLEGFPPPEAALLRMADAMADTPSNISADLYAELRRHFFEEQMIELAACAALET
jgi:alkylhydroperoxidase family enzyme